MCWLVVVHSASPILIIEMIDRRYQSSSSVSGLFMLSWTAYVHATSKLLGERLWCWRRGLFRHAQPLGPLTQLARPFDHCICQQSTPSTQISRPVQCFMYAGGYQSVFVILSTCACRHQNDGGNDTTNCDVHTTESVVLTPHILDAGTTLRSQLNAPWEDTALARIAPARKSPRGPSDVEAMTRTLPTGASVQIR